MGRSIRRAVGCFRVTMMGSSGDERNAKMSSSDRSMIRTRWAAIGAAIALALGGGGVGLVSATASSGERTSLVSIKPCRVVDVRPEFQVGPKSSPLGPGEVLTVSAHGSNGNCTGIPNDAVALSLNVTATDATAPTFLAVWQDGVPRPDEGSSLNPTPGAPPTPNAVTTRLSPTGQFNIYNLAGSVNVFVDINGYYVDHNHDDRYDTSAEVDAKIAAAEARAAATTMSRSMYDMLPAVDGTSWVRTFAYVHAGTASTECVVAPFDPVEGQTLTGASVSYLNDSGVPQQLDVTVYRFRTDPGPFGGVAGEVIDEVGSIEGDVPTAAGTAFYERRVVIDGDPVIRAGYRYATYICSDGEISIIGATIELE